jgi:hypothetical protein
MPATFASFCPQIEFRAFPKVIMGVSRAGELICVKAHEADGTINAQR